MMKLGKRRSMTVTCGLALCAQLAAVDRLAGQQQEREGLAAYDYANLGFNGLAAEVFVVYPTETNSAVGYGGRIDLGYLGPKLRVQLRGGYWSSELKESEVVLFEERIADLVEEQNGTRPTIDLGVIERSAVVAGGDFHWVFVPTAQVRPYIGIGAELYVLSGSGAAIDETFVDDSLDLLTIGASAIAGLDVGIGSVFNVFGEVRGSLAADIRSIGIAGGIAIRWR